MSQQSAAAVTLSLQLSIAVAAVVVGLLTQSVALRRRMSDTDSVGISTLTRRMFPQGSVLTLLITCSACQQQDNTESKLIASSLQQGERCCCMCDISTCHACELQLQPCDSRDAACLQVAAARPQLPTLDAIHQTPHRQSWPLAIYTYVQELVKRVLGVLASEHQQPPVALSLQRLHL